MSELYLEIKGNNTGTSYLLKVHTAELFHDGLLDTLWAYSTGAGAILRRSKLRLSHYSFVRLLTRDEYWEIIDRWNQAHV
jgi:hypothetical protein